MAGSPLRGRASGSARAGNSLGLEPAHICGSARSAKLRIVGGYAIVVLTVLCAGARFGVGQSDGHGKVHDAVPAAASHGDDLSGATTDAIGDGPVVSRGVTAQNDVMRWHVVAEKLRDPVVWGGVAQAGKIVLAA